MFIIMEIFPAASQLNISFNLLSIIPINFFPLYILSSLFTNFIQCFHSFIFPNLISFQNMDFL